MSGGIGGGADEGFDLTTKGQIHGHDGTSQVAISVGTNGQVLKANSGTSSGLEWQDASGGAEYNTFTTATTWNPTAQTGNTTVNLDGSSMTAGVLKLNVDGSLVKTITFGNSGIAIVNPSTSLSVQSTGLGEDFANTQSISTINPRNDNGNAGYGLSASFWSPNGDYFYSSQKWNGSNTQNRLDCWSCSTAFDFTTKSYQGYVVPQGANNGEGYNYVSFTPDGLKFIGVDGGNYNNSSGTSTVYEYTLSTAYELYTMTTTASNSFSLTAVPNNGGRHAISKDGTKFFTYSQSTNTFYRHSMSTAWDITTLSNDSNTKSGLTTPSNINSLWINDNGTNIYIKDSVLNRCQIRKYNYGTAYDNTTLTYDSLIDTGIGMYNPNGQAFIPANSGFNDIIGVGSSTLDNVTYGFEFAGTGYASVSQ